MLCDHSVFLVSHSIGPQPVIPIRSRMSSCYAAAGRPFSTQPPLGVILKAGKRLPTQGKRRPEGSVLRFPGTVRLSGIPNAARYPLWGEASWNAYGVFYYLSGFIGYLLLGLYFRKFVGRLSWGRTLAFALPLFLSGFAVCHFGFLSRVAADANGVFPVEGPVGLAALWEGPWLNDTFGVALMSVAWILLFRKIERGGRFYARVLLPVSRASYGMYLCHMLLLGIISAWLRTSLGLGTEGALGAVWTTPVQILGTAVISFVGVAVFSVAVQKIPKVGKWLIG